MLLTLIHILDAALPLGYFVALAWYIHHFVRDDSEKQESFAGSWLLYGLIAAHLGYMIMRGVAYNAVPLASKPEFLSLVALSLASIYALLERRFRESHTGMFFLGIAFPFQLLASVGMGDPNAQKLLLEHPTLENPIFGVHVISMVVAFAALAVGALYSVMYILLARQLKKRELGLVFKRMPPLLTLESQSKLASYVGITFLGLGLGLGHLMVFAFEINYDLLDPKIVVMDLAWLAYIIGLIGIRIRGMSAMSAGYLSLFAYVALMMMMAATNVIQTFHTFH